LVNAARHLPTTFEPSRPLCPWVRQIAVNALRDKARSSSRHRALSLAGQTGTPVAEAPAARGHHEEEVDTADLLRHLLDTFAGPQERAAVLMRLNGFKLREVADRRDWPVG